MIASATDAAANAATATGHTAHRRCPPPVAAVAGADSADVTMMEDDDGAASTRNLAKVHLHSDRPADARPVAVKYVQFYISTLIYIPCMSKLPYILYEIPYILYDSHFLLTNYRSKWR